MIDDLLRLIHRLLHGSDETRALHAEHKRLSEAGKGRSPAEFVKEQRAVLASRKAMRLGRLLEAEDADFLISLEELLVHLLILGASGSGKSFFLLLLAVSAWLLGIPIVLVDPKGEMSSLLLEQLLPSMLAGMSPAEQARRLATLRVIDPFDATHLPAMNPLVRDPGISIDLQALDVGSCIDASIDAGSGVRMETILDWLQRLVIGHGTFLTVRRALQEPAVLEGLVRACRDRDTVSYFLTRWPTEPQASKSAVLARLDRLLALPATRLSLSAPTMLDFDAMLTSGLTVVNVGNAPAGLTDVAGFWTTLVVTKLVRAIYRRPATGANVPPAILLIDEWQSALTRPLIASMEDVLARARSRRVALWLCNQQRAQIERISSPLWSIVAGQTSVQVLFRATLEDARAMRHILPTTGRISRRVAPGDRPKSASPFLSPAEEREARVEEIAQLPNRTAYLWDRRKPWPAVRFRTATLELPSARSVPRQLADAVARGTVALPVAELEHAMEAERTRLDQLARAGAPTPDPQAPPAARRRRKPGPGGLPW